MAVAVFDADVLIAFLGAHDANHDRAVERMRAALDPSTRRLVSAVNYSEVLIGPLRRLGPAGAARVDAMIAKLGIEILPVDLDAARRAARIRAGSRLSLPDAYAIATAIDASELGPGEVRLESFDEQVLRAYPAVRKA